MIKYAYTRCDYKKVNKLQAMLRSRFTHSAVFYRFVLFIHTLLTIKFIPPRDRDYVRVNLLNKQKYRNMELDGPNDKRLRRYSLKRRNTLKADLVPSVAALLFKKCTPS